MNTRIIRKAGWAAAAVLATAWLTAAPSAQTAQGPALPAVGHTVAAHGRPREPHASVVPVRLSGEELALFRSLLEAGGTSGPGRRATIEGFGDSGLLLTLTLPPYEPSRGAGERVLAYRLRVDALGRGTLAASERIYTRGCADLASCVPVAEEAGALHAAQARRVVDQLKEFWSLRALKVGRPS
jgi:hypothetical protein